MEVEILFEKKNKTCSLEKKKYKTCSLKKKENISCFSVVQRGCRGHLEDGSVFRFLCIAVTVAVS